MSHKYSHLQAKWFRDRLKTLCVPVGCALTAAALVSCAADGRAASPAAPTQTEVAAAAPAPRIVALGDSLTTSPGPRDSYPAVLQTRVTREGYRFDVVNAGVSSDTTAGALRRFDTALEGNVQILIVALGANDGIRGVPVEQVKRNLAEIIERAQRRGIQVLLCGMDALPRYGWRYTLAFHDLFPDLARQYRVGLMPFLLEDVVGNPDLNQSDGIHPNARGAAVMAANLWPHLLPLLNSAAAVTTLP